MALINPTSGQFRDGVSTIEPWIFKLQGSYTLPWDIIASGNLNMYDGAARTLTINGPGSVYGGVNAAGAATTISYTTLEFQDRDAFRFDPIKLLDLGVQKVFQFNGGRQRIKLILDAFNVFNINTITATPAATSAPRAARSRARSCRRACSASGRSSCSNADRGFQTGRGSRTKRDADHADHESDGTRITQITNRTGRGSRRSRIGRDADHADLRLEKGPGLYRPGPFFVHD